MKLSLPLFILYNKKLELKVSVHNRMKHWKQWLKIFYMEKKSLLIKLHFLAHRNISLLRTDQQQDVKVLLFVQQQNTLRSKKSIFNFKPFSSYYKSGMKHC